jgi:hypothetical protein
METLPRDVINIIASCYEQRSLSCTCKLIKQLFYNYQEREVISNVQFISPLVVDEIRYLSRMLSTTSTSYDIY